MEWSWFVVACSSGRSVGCTSSNRSATSLKLATHERLYIYVAFRKRGSDIASLLSVTSESHLRIDIKKWKSFGTCFFGLQLFFFFLHLVLLLLLHLVLLLPLLLHLVLLLDPGPPFFFKLRACSLRLRHAVGFGSAPAAQAEAVTGAAVELRSQPVAPAMPGIVEA